VSVRTLLLPLVLAVCALVALPASGGAAATPVAHAAKTCNISGKERKLGTSYVLKLTATRVSCGKAQKLVKAYNACRHEKGKAGRCTRKVSGFSFSERRLDQIDTQYDAKVTAKKGSKRVAFTYTQFT